MKYTKEVILQSESGYCMPFEERQGKDVKLSLGYGEMCIRDSPLAECLVTYLVLLIGGCRYGRKYNVGA